MAEAKKNQADQAVPVAEKPPGANTPQPQGKEGESGQTTADVGGPMLHQVRIPDVIAVLPVRDAVAFPGAVIPLTIGRDKSRRLLDDIMPGEKILGVLTQKNDSVENPQPTDMHSVGTVAIVLKMLRPADGQQSIVVHGLVRFRVLEFVQQEPYLKARVEALPDAPVSFGPETELLVGSVRQAAKRMIELSPNIPDEAAGILNDIDSPSTLADFLAANLHDSVPDKLALLEETDVVKRLQMVREKLATRIELLELEEKIQSQVRSSIDKNQRHYFLQEQIKAIQKELGQADEQSQELSDLKKRIDEAKVPEAVKKETDRELTRLAAVPQASPEYGVIRSFLETVAELPWSKSTKDDLDIHRAREILERDHYDLEKIKKRIIEFLAVRKLNPAGRGPILCFLGPPGVGKTSLGKSIAESLGRKFVRMSLGGVRDEADIRGHRRTYVGSMPGRIIQELRKVGTNNPVMMLDEVDKLGADFRGDPSAALLEVLDPEQNNSFQDHYLGVPFDLSNIIFICTANYMEPVPPALRDRMEVIEIPGYTQQDKLLIGRKYLIPRQLKENGLTRRQCEIPSATLEAIIDRYTREAGVRNLERTIGSVVRGVAAKLVETSNPTAHTAGAAKPAKLAKAGKGSTPPAPADAANTAANAPVKTASLLATAAKITVQPDDLATYLGPLVFESEVALRTATPGVATGLAYTPAGGDILFVEATQMPGKGRLRLTGQIGNVMRESAHAAYSLLKNNADKLGIKPGVFRDMDVHVHVPAGAVPKDGPSAGVAMYTALASLFTNQAVRPDVAMTGEITLRGLVLPIGGVKEKVIAAQHAGIKTVILPDRNERNLQEIRQQLKKDVKFVFVKTVDEVLAAAFNSPTATPARTSEAAKANGLPRKTARRGDSPLRAREKAAT
jgi:ATP-dependent Lon protease